MHELLSRHEHLQRVPNRRDHQVWLRRVALKVLPQQHTEIIGGGRE